MKKQINQLSIQIATVNGSGSQSSNLILLRSLFQMGLPVSGKNLFPSNIAGLPTWFTLRVNQKNYTSMEEQSDIFIALNKETVTDDLAKVKPGGFFLYNGNLKFDLKSAPKNIELIPVDFSAVAGAVNKSIKLKKLLTNMVYVGVVAEMLSIPNDVIEQSIQFQFKNKESVIDINRQAVLAGREHYKQHLSIKQPYELTSIPATNNKMLIDGNTAGAIGAVFGGCSFVSWYPITPSSSLAENFESYCKKFRSKDGTNNFAVVQAEDELSAISMITGAGWAGARAMTSTSGPGVSLMAECAGLMYFAEVPGVIWNVQRAGPSTGLPTRTMQADVMSSAFLSHGDAKHPLLFPATPKECFDFAQVAFDLSDRLQTLVLVLSDLDLGMNSWVSEPFEYSEKPYDRGKVLSKKELDKIGEFHRYRDLDGDGIPYRTLPGTEHDQAGYFTRGTGHNESAGYTEDHTVFKKLLDRLNKKWETTKSLVPTPLIDKTNNDVGIIAYGSTDLAIQEVRDHLDHKTSYMRIRSFPFNDDVKSFIKSHKVIYVIEQNRDGQMKSLLASDFPELAPKLKSILSYDGLPVRATKLIHEVKNAHT